MHGWHLGFFLGALIGYLLVVSGAVGCDEGDDVCVVAAVSAAEYAGPIFVCGAVGGAIGFVWELLSDR
jgi:hypothetical protein